MKIIYLLPLFRFFQRYYFYAFSTIAVSIYILQRFEISLPRFLHYYANDLLCMPIVLYGCRAVVRFLRKEPNLQLPATLLLILTLFYSVYFEYYLPQHNNRYTSDGMDVLMYFLGTTFFYGIEFTSSRFSLKQEVDVVTKFGTFIGQGSKS